MPCGPAAAIAVRALGTGPGITKLTFPVTSFTMDFGGTAEGAARARAAAWDASKRFLAAL